MPCDDITEVVELRLDPDDRLLGYALTKRTCGAEIGRAALLADLFVGLRAEEIAALDGEDVANRYPAMAEEQEFLAAKHLVAVRAAARVYLGVDAGAPGDACALASLGADASGVTFRGAVSIDLLTSEIEACARCCGARKKESPRRGAPHLRVVS